MSILDSGFWILDCGSAGRARARGPGRRWGHLGLLIACAAAARAEPAVQLQVDSRQVFVREAVPITLTVSEFTEAELGPLPAVPNSTLRATGGPAESSFVQIVNGRRTESHTRRWQFELVPYAAGELVLPPLSLEVDGQTVQTKSVTLNAQPGVAEQYLAAEVSIGRTRAFVGQRVRATLTIWLKPLRRGGQTIDAGSMLQIVNPIAMGPFPNQVSNAGRFDRPRDVGGRTEMWYAYDFVADLLVERPGPLALGDIEIGAAYPIGGRPRQFRARAEPPALEALAVPQEGRPADFAGAVGVYDIETRAAPRAVRVGDPITLTIELFGDGPVDTLPPPRLADDAALADAFRVPEQILAGETINARRRFNVTIRAKRADVREIPALSYSYFDPDAERFVTARSAPIPLEVTAAAEVVAPDLPRADDADRAPDLQQLDGLRDIETNPAVLLGRASTPAAGAVTAAMVAPPVAFAAGWIGSALVARRRADPGRLRRRRAARAARAHIRAAAGAFRSSAAGPGGTAGPARAIAAAMGGYVADRLNEPPARFLGAAVVDELRRRGVSARVVDLWAAILRQCEEVSFGAGGADADGLARQALVCLEALERERL